MAEKLNRIHQSKPFEPGLLGCGPLSPSGTMLHDLCVHVANKYIERGIKKLHQLVAKNIKKEEMPTNNQNDSPPQVVLPATSEKLKVRRSTFFMDSSGKEIKLYHTRGRQRGVLVLFSYSEFTTGEEYRDVASDNELLTDVFRQVGFKLILRYENKTKQETLDIIEGLQLAGFDCMFFVASSHGYALHGSYDIEFRCTDGGLVSTHDVVDMFTSKKRPELDGVPKVFIFQACRGTKLPPELEGVLTCVSNFTDQNPRRRTAPTRAYSDILIAHSTLPGFASPRIDKPNKGSWYMQSLCKIIANHAHNHHMLELFQLVDKDLAPRGINPTCDNWGFTRHLYLHPGLFEDANGNAKPIQ